MMKIWGRRSSFNVQKVLWLVAELGIAHKHIDAGGRFGGLDTPEFLAMNPNGKIPVLQDTDGTTVWESHAILRYLAAKYCGAAANTVEARATAMRTAADASDASSTSTAPNASNASDASAAYPASRPAHCHTLWSNDPAIQSRADRWMDWTQSTLQPAFLTGVFWGFYRTPEAQRDWPAIERSLAQGAKLFRLLDTELAKHPYLTGDALTLADIAVGTALYRYYELDIERPQLPHVEAWYDRLRERDAYRNHVMIPFDELRGNLEY
ncbi:glutathione S-transferase [Alcaligenaceae bacterium A4P071]|nr:glutathione S-transferase [Alcaligenaceae bacterium A4P071]